jgi:hypothetical protein
MRDEGVYSPADSDALAFAKAQEIARCELCDDDGLRGMHVCNHVDYSGPARRGMALIREALAKEGK